MGGIISGLLGIGSAAIGASLNARENYKQRQHQTSERVASQQWQDMQRREQNQFSESMYKRYQSPQAMVQQYRSAGLNPLLAVDGTAAPAVSSGSSGSAPMGGSTSAIPIMAPSTLSGSFQDIAGGLKALADARKSGVETDITKSIADDIVKSWKLSNVGKEIANGISAIKLRYLDQKEQLEVQQALQALSRGDIGIKEARENLRLLEKRNLLTQKEVDWYDQRISKQLELADSEISKNAASENLANQQARTQGSVRRFLGSQVELNEQMKVIRSADAAIANLKRIKIESSPATRHEIMDNVFQSSYLSNCLAPYQLKQLKEAVEYAEKTNDWFEADRIIQHTERIIDASSDWLFPPSEEFYDFASDKSTSTVYDSKGNVKSTTVREGGSNRTRGRKGRR